jgi:hypothetical protein
MIIFRPHRGQLSDAMAETREFNTEQEMKEYIVDSWKGYISIEDITLDENVGDDDRIGWKNVHYVCTKRLGKENYIALYGNPQCIGMCSTEYQKQYRMDIL